MGDALTDFETQFHSIQGDLISERKKNFFKLLRNPSLTLNAEQLDSALKNLQPKNYLESLFRIDALIYFRKTVLLREILKEGNEVFISKIIKQPWFVQEAFKDMEARKFVNDFLPCLSYSIRMKLLKRISLTWSEAQMDDLYDCLLERYGLQIATNIFHKCSCRKFKTILDENEIKLKTSQLKQLFDRDTDLFKIYLEHHKKLDQLGYEEEQHISKHGALKNPKVLLDLEKDNKIRITRLGRRTSKRVVDLIKNDVLNDIDKYSNFLNKSVIVRKLRNEFPKLYKQIFPKKISEVDMYASCNSLILFYPKNKRWELFSQTFMEIYGTKNLDDIFTNLNNNFLKLYPNNDIVQRWAEANYDHNNNESYLKYLLPVKLIPLLKEKINLTSDIYRRKKFVLLLVENCAQNKDLTALEEVLKYICYRHRNEDDSFRDSLMELISRLFKLEELNEIHWKYICEQLKLMKVRKNYYNYTYAPFIIRYLEFLFKHGKPYKDVLIEFVSDVVKENQSFHLDLKNPEIEAKIYADIANNLPDIFKDDIKNYKLSRIKLISNVISFSNAFPEHCIKLTEFPIFMEYITSLFEKNEKFSEDVTAIIKDVLLYNISFPQNAVPVENSKILELLLNIGLNEDNYHHIEVIKKMVMKKSRSDFDNEVLDNYFKKLFDKYPSPDIVMWFLTNDVSAIVPYFDKIITNSLEANLLKFKDIKRYSHFGFDKKIVDYYIGVLKGQISDKKDISRSISKKLHFSYRVGIHTDKKLTLVENLAMLLPTEDFAQVIDDYFLPKKDKLDLEDAEMKEIYKTQCEIAKIFYKVPEPQKMLNVVMRFCIGDYLASALPSLYSLFYRSPEKQLPLYVDILSKRAISVRKHAVFLSCELLDHRRVLNILKTTKQSNVSSQKHLFSAALKHFLKNPTQELLDLVITNMSAIDKSDTETLDSLKDIRVPKKYRAMYVEKCWGFFESLEGSGVKINCYLNKLLGSINSLKDILAEIPSTFVKNVINRYFKETIPDLDNINLFVLNIWRYRKSEHLEYFDLVFDILSKFKYKGIREFFNVFIWISFKDEDRDFIIVFTQYWNKCFTLIDTFEEHILIKLLGFSLIDTSVEKYAFKVVEYFEQLISELGFHVYEKFEGALKQDLNKKSMKDRYLFFQNMLNIKCTPSLCILVLKLMENISENDEDKELVEMYGNIMKILGNIEEPIVQVYYKSYINNINE